MTGRLSVTIDPDPRDLADRLVPLIATEGAQALTNARVDCYLHLAPGTAAALFETSEDLVTEILDAIARAEGRLWIGLGPMAPETVEELPERYDAFVAAVLRDGLDPLRARLSLTAAFPGQLRHRHEDFAEMTTVILDRLGVPEPADRGRMLLALVEGVVVHAYLTGHDPDRPVPGLGRAIRRVLS